MKFILNTSLDPHFCALLNEEDGIIDQLIWDDRRKTGKIVWDFLAKHQPTDLSFIGGITGPGGFTNLRVSSSILNALAEKFTQQVHMIRADKFIHHYLEQNGTKIDIVILNSFSDGVFFSQNGFLKRLKGAEAASLSVGKSVFLAGVPEDKQAFFTESKIIKLPTTSIQPQDLYTVLKLQTPVPQFVPDYEFPAVVN